MKKVFCLLFVFVSVSAVAQKQGQALVDSFLMELPKAKEDTSGIKLLNELADAFINNKKGDSGVSYARQALEMATKLRWQAGIARSYNIIGVYYLRKDDSTNALYFFKKSLRLYQELGMNNSVGMVTENIGNVYNRIEKNYEKAVEYYGVALKMNEDFGNKQDIPPIAAKMALTCRALADEARSLQILLKNLKFCEENGNIRWAATSSKYIGIQYNYRGDYARANEYLQKAVGLFEQVNDKKEKTNAYVWLGVNFLSINDYDHALEYGKNALKLAEEINDSELFDDPSIVIAKSYIGQKEYIQAIDFSLKSLKLSKDTRNNYFASYAYCVIGSAYLSLAEDTTRLAGRVRRNIEFHSTAYRQQAYIPSEKTKLLKLSITYLQQGLDSCKKMGDWEGIRDCYESLWRAYRASGDFKRALEYHLQYIAYKDRIFNNDKSKKLTEAQLQFEFGLKEAKEKAEQEKKDALALRMLKEQKREKMFFLGGSLLMLLIAGGSVYFLIYTRRAKKMVEEQKNRAERSERFKQQFLANMSHEIRTPMNAVLGMTNLALDNPLTPKVSNYITAVKKSSENLLVIINDVLDLSKLEAGKMDLEKIPFRLSEQVRQVYDTMHFKAEEKGLILLTRIAKDIPDILIGDPSRLNQVLINLCGNAIKFTEKGTVRVVVERVTNTTPALSKGEGDVTATLCFKVIDSGIGIPTDKLGRLFESFNQADASTARKYGGTGLGLSISKTLVELQGGKMEVKSEEGNGSEFCFTMTYDIAGENAMAEIDTGSKTHPAWLQGIHILVAEDNEYNQVVVKDTLQNLIRDVKVDLADNGKIAIEKLQANDYDVILMDAQMPEMTGLEASIYIRKNMEGRKQSIPIIALTASVLNTDLNKCTDAGMNAYVPKPFKREELLNTLARFYKNEFGKEIEKEAISADEAIAEKEPVTGKVTDLSFLHDFCDSDRDRMKKYIDIYLKVTPGNLERISDSLSREDYSTVAKMVHAMKAHLNYMGMKQTRELAEQMERYALNQANPDQLQELFIKLQNDWKKSQEELCLFN